MRDTKGLESLFLHSELGKQVNPVGFGVAQANYGSRCLQCKGGKMLCGELYCPIIRSLQALLKPSSKVDGELICGSTPPSVFVGRMGYPKVYIGPMVPPYFGDTAVLDAPELWVGRSIDEIVDYRFSLVRGKARVDVHDAQLGGRLVSLLQELCMAEKPVDSEVLLKKKPSKTLFLSSDLPPFGPSAPLKSFDTSSIYVDRRIEKAFYDGDLKASEAVLKLYRSSVSVTRIQRCFSLGVFGLTSGRKIVPTRWSITAVDSIVSKALIDEVKHYGTIDEYRVYFFNNLDNIFAAILMPEKWSFEWMEAWFPGTTWNQGRSGPEIMSDSEPYQGRVGYPEIGGCYYSARLAAAEKLSIERRQASVLLLREIHSGYIVPVGVWNVRESVRRALKTKPEAFDSLQKALEYAETKLTIPVRKWVEHSTLLKQFLFQKRMIDFLRKPLV